MSGGAGRPAPPTAALPAGYVRLAVGSAELVCLADLADGFGAALAAAPPSAPTLHGWAATHPERRTFRGRALAHAAPLPGTDATVVVRHATHGGMLAPVTRDLFLPPTRAPRELAVSRALRARGIRTPEVAAYVRYPAPFGLSRVDVATRLVPDGRDLAVALAEPFGEAEVRPWVRATAALLHAMGHAGARHPDLNLKNVLLTPVGPPAATSPDAAPSGSPAQEAEEAWVLDVDVLRLARDGGDAARARRITAANLARLERSLHRANDRWGLRAAPVELALLGALALRGPDARVEIVWRPGHNVGPT
mgnify:CR=1 FL=1